MTTMERANPWAGFVLILVGLAAVALLVPAFLLAPRPTIPAPNQHAVERHGATEAQIATEWVRSNGQYCKWSCPDGRDRFACHMGNGSGWAVVVMEGAELVTAFVTDNQAYVSQVIAPCKNPFRYSH